MKAERASLLEAKKSKEAQLAALWLKLEARAAEVKELQRCNRELQEDQAKSAHEQEDLRDALSGLQSKLQSALNEKDQLRVRLCFCLSP